MTVLSEHEVFIFVAQLGIIVLFARIFGEISKKLGQPIIVGEVIAGIILGPTIFGYLLPDWRGTLFPSSGPQPYLLQGISWLCVIFLLLITGLEIDLRASIRQGKQCILISLLGLVAAFIGVYCATFFLPSYFYPDGIVTSHVNLLIAVALSVVGIDVIAKILFDLKILRSEAGVKILTSGVLSDCAGWTLIAVAIALVSTGSLTVATILKPLIVMILYLVVTLTIGNTLIDRFLDFIGYKELDTTITLSLLFSFALINGAIAHLLGIHVIFGAFITGIMAGESEKITPYIRQWTQDFIFAIFAPIFFVLIGMQLKFTTTEIWIPIIIFLIVSSLFKIGGAFFGGIWGGLGRRNALTVACGLNTQGTMGIIVAMIAFKLGLFNADLFSMIIMICVLTSLFIGPLLKWAMIGVKRPLAKYFDRKHVFLDVKGSSKKEVIKRLTALMAERRIITDQRYVKKAIWEREKTMSTAIGEGVALPHARLPDLKFPVLCFFRLESAIDFGSPDNKPVQLLFLELTNQNDDGMQLNLISQVARFISSERNRQRLLTCQREEDIEHILTFDEKA
ncbi:MAG: cation:proton antiporter [Candidatus Omnitrophica bacterium]|nr:cation:proton antiporter [Candidatus Omnitrophota bacterium]